MQTIERTITVPTPLSRVGGFRLEGENSTVKLRDTITFEGDDTGTTVTYHAEFQPKGATKLLEPLLPLGLKRLGDKTSDQLESCLRDLAGAPTSQENA